MRIRGRIGASHEVVDLLVAGGQIRDISPADLLQPCDLGNEVLRLSPGFVDLQINGYGGVDFNDAATTTDQITATTRALWQTGITSFCPTVVTESSEHISQCLTNLIRAADESPEFARAMLGVHLEGPFISPEDGPRGAHPRQHVC